MTATGESVDHTYTSENNYTVILRVYDSNGYELFNQAIPVSPGLFSRDKNLTREKPEVYPVPVNDQLYLRSPGIFHHLEQIEIFAAGGQIIMISIPVQQEYDLLRLDVSRLTEGFYIGKLIYKDGSVQSFRFVK
jgi:hypothetical protein